MNALMEMGQFYNSLHSDFRMEVKNFVVTLQVAVSFFARVLTRFFAIYLNL